MFSHNSIENPVSSPSPHCITNGGLSIVATLKVSAETEVY
jgi:hypothetical protein